MAGHHLTCLTGNTIGTVAIGEELPALLRRANRPAEPLYRCRCVVCDRKFVRGAYYLHELRKSPSLKTGCARCSARLSRPKTHEARDAALVARVVAFRKRRLNGEYGETMSEIAKAFGLSKQRVAQIVKRENR